MQPLKITKVLVGDDNIILAVVDYRFDISTVAPGQHLRVVYGEYILASLPGKLWHVDGTVSDPPITYTWDDLRQHRDRELASTDWTQVGDAPLPPQKVQEYAVWRQQLRNLPQQHSTPDEAMVALEALLNTKP